MARQRRAASALRRRMPANQRRWSWRRCAPANCGTRATPCAFPWKRAIARCMERWSWKAFLRGRWRNGPFGISSARSGCWHRSLPGSKTSTETRLRRLLLALRRLRLPNNLPYEIHFLLAVRRSVELEDIVEPHRRLLLRVRIRMLPRIPRQPRLRFARHQPPIDRRHFVLLGDRQNALERAPVRPRHILRAQDGPLILLQPFHPLLELLRLAVTVEGNDVGLLHLNLLDGTQLIRRRPVPLPQPRRDRLRRPPRPCILENLRQQRQHQLFLIRLLYPAITRLVQIVRLVPHVPRQNPVVVRERQNQLLHILQNPQLLLGIGQRHASGTLHPPRIVDALLRRPLMEQLRERIPAGIQQHKDRLDVVLLRHTQKPVDALPESRRILLPQQVMQKQE